MRSTKGQQRLHVRTYAKNRIVKYTVDSPSGLLSLGWLQALLLLLAVSARHYSECIAAHMHGHGAALSEVLLDTLWIPLTSLLFAFNALTRTQESILVIRSVGLQLSRRRVLHFLGRTIPVSSESVNFLSLKTVKDVLILEGIQGWSVIFYLAVLQDEGLVPKNHIIFPDALPRLAVLKQVYFGVRQVLHGEIDEGRKRISRRLRR